MDKNQELERGIIPAGTRIKLYEGRVTLLEDVAVDANQEWIDKAIQDQKDFYNGIGTTSEPKLAAGATSAMHVSKSVGSKAISGHEGCSKASDNEQLDASVQKVTRDAAKVLNIANNARFINIVEWRTNMIDRLLSCVYIKTVDEAISECQKLENHIFDKKNPDAPEDWKLI